MYLRTRIYGGKAFGTLPVPSPDTKYTDLNQLNSVSYVFLFLCLCILIDKYVLFCILFANWHYTATLTEVFPRFFLSCKVVVKCSEV